MNKLKMVALIVVSLLCVAVVGGAYAAYVIERQIVWQYENVVESFKVEGNSLIDFGAVVGPQIRTANFTVVNDGNVALTVEPSVSNTGNVSVSWNMPSAHLEPNATAIFILTLNISGEGNCVVSFRKA